jgi:hypothetical protein
MMVPDVYGPLVMDLSVGSAPVTATFGTGNRPLDHTKSLGGTTSAERHGKRYIYRAIQLATLHARSNKLSSYCAIGRLHSWLHIPLHNVPYMRDSAAEVNV